MKRKTRSRTASGVLEMKGRILKQIDVIASRAQTQVERKANWVSGKVVQAMEKIDRARK